MPETQRGKQRKDKGKVRKYHLMTFSEDERSVASEKIEASGGREEAEKLDEIGSDENDTISESSIESTNKTNKKRKRKLVNPVIDTGDESKQASDRRKDYSKRKNSSLCEQILAAKSNRKSIGKLKSDQNDENDSDDNDEFEAENKDSKHDAEITVAKKKEKKTSKLFKMFSKETKSKEEDNTQTKENNDIEVKTEEESENENESEDGNQEEINETEEQTSSGPVPLEKQVKFCQDRAVHVEKNYGAFCQTLSSITRKIARMRDKGDLLSKQVLEFADKEKVSVSTTKNLRDFAHNLAAIQDYRDAEIHRLESKVVKPLSSYGPKCKKVKQVIKTEQGAINREIKQRKNLEKVRDKKPGDAHSITAAETEHQKAAADAAIGSQGLQNQMRVFEKEKLTDLKRILADYVSVEMVFHAKAIEYYSQCFENLAMIDEELDLDEFSRKLNLTQAPGTDTASTGIPPGMAVPQGTITSLGSTVRSSTMETTGTSDYTSTGDSYTYTYTYGDSTTSSGEKRVRIQTVGQSMYADAEEDDDDEDDDDDDDDEDDPQLYSRPMRR